MEENDLYLYRITAQNKEDNSETYAVHLLVGSTQEEALQVAKNDELFKQPAEQHYSNFIIEPICTEKEWKEGVVSYCPRCGYNISNMKIGRGDIFKCFHCSATVECNVIAVAVVEK